MKKKQMRMIQRRKTKISLICLHLGVPNYLWTKISSLICALMVKRQFSTRNARSTFMLNALKLMVLSAVSPFMKITKDWLLKRSEVILRIGKITSFFVAVFLTNSNWWKIMKVLLHLIIGKKWSILMVVLGRSTSITIETRMVWFIVKSRLVARPLSVTREEKIA